MATLIKKQNMYYSKIQVRIGDRSLNKRKAVYINLETDTRKEAKRKNAMVTKEEHTIRKEIRMGEATKSDLLNIDHNTDWEWEKKDGTPTSMKLHTLGEYVWLFIKFKQNKKLKDSSIQSYRIGLETFIAAIGHSHLIADIDDESIDRFLEYMNNKELALHTRDSYLRSLSIFLKWCVQRDYLSKAPYIEYYRANLQNKWLTEAEYHAIINYDDYATKKGSVNLDSVNLSPRRFKRVFKLYGETGLRLAEGFYGVLTQDDNGIWLAIPNEKSKNGKGRTIQVNTEQRDTIRMIQEIFIEQGQKELHYKYYSRMFRKVADKLGIPKHKSFHSLRHYYGKTQVTITGNIYQVAGMMGHSSIKVTEDYYVKGFDMKATLRDFPSLKQYLITPKNRQNIGWDIPNGIYQSDNGTDSSSLN